MRTEIKFRAKSQSACHDGCGTVRTGACGESFVGKFKCRYKSNCSSKKYCICIVRVFCKTNTIKKQVYEKTISFGARSMLVPRVTTTSEHDTPKPGTENTPEHGTPDTPDPEPGTPTTPEPDTPEPGASSTPEPNRPEPGTPDTQDPEPGIPTTPEPDIPDYGAPDRPGTGTPTTPEPGTPDTPEQEDNKTKSKLGKRKKLFLAFRSMLLPVISTTPEPDRPVPGKSSSPELDTPESGTPTTPDPDTPEPGTLDTVELEKLDLKENNKIKKNDWRKSKLGKVRQP